MNINKRFIFIIVIVIAVIIVVGGISSYIYTKNKNNFVVCTKEAKQCLDGSYVGRTGPKCEFASCPNISASTTANWLKDLIKKEESNPVANPPALISKCVYKNQNVYYLPARCCDISSVLYNNEGNIICSPDGGLTGKGNGKCVDFFDIRKDCVIVWKDTRN